MVIELSHAQFDAFCDAYDKALRDQFKKDLISGVGNTVLEGRADGLGVSVDAFLNATFKTCERLGTNGLESFIVHACIALELPSARAANPGLFDWIDGLMARTSPPADQRLGIIQKRIAAMANVDPDAHRMNKRIRACQRSDE
jgi:hypothetical protein